MDGTDRTGPSRTATQTSGSPSVAPRSSRSPGRVVRKSISKPPAQAQERPRRCHRPLAGTFTVSWGYSYFIFTLGCWECQPSPEVAARDESSRHPGHTGAASARRLWPGRHCVGLPGAQASPATADAARSRADRARPPARPGVRSGLMASQGSAAPSGSSALRRRTPGPDDHHRGGGHGAEPGPPSGEAGRVRAGGRAGRQHVPVGSGIERAEEWPVLAQGSGAAGWASSPPS